MSPATGKYLIIAGVILALAGLILYFFGNKLGFLGRLPGDIRIEGKSGGGFYFPMTTCIILSIVLTLIVRVVMWLMK